MREHSIGQYKVHTFEHPPHGFDPLTASASALIQHGLPRRPDPVAEPGPSLLWVQTMRKYRDLGFQHVVPEFREHPEIVHGPNKQANSTTRGLVNATSANWSGSVLFTDPVKDPFTWITGQWTVPNAYSPNPGDGKTYYSSAWLGIDGDGSTDVLQAGTATEVTGGNSSVCYAWWEWYPAVSVKIANFPFIPGDAARLLICSTGPASAYFSYTNITSKRYTSFSVTAPIGTALVGDCAEAVVERPGLGFYGILAQLPRYGENFFDETTAYTKSGASFDIGAGTTISMLADDGITIISTPEVVDTDAIRLFYSGA